MKKIFFLLISILLNINIFCQNVNNLNIDVAVIGGGASGITAGIQSARSGAKTIIIEPTTWLGGMLTAAGMSCVEGNNMLNSGLWEEFRQGLYAHYKTKNLNSATGTNNSFEPSIGNKILQDLAAKEPNLKIYFEHNFQKIIKSNDKVTGCIVTDKNGNSLIINAKIVVDASELGDVFAAADVEYDLGMDSKKSSGETQAQGSNNIIQDLTYVAILKDYGSAADKTIAKPAYFNPAVFQCSCRQLCSRTDIFTAECDKILSFGRLPNKKYMLNWQSFGNHFYTNVVEKTPKEREEAYKKAKEQTLSFLYFIQTELGYKNIGLADDEFPTIDKLPFIPFNREGRRMKGIVRMNVNHISKPYNYQLFKTGIAVGDYPINIHHAKFPNVPRIDIPPIPSFSVPMGALIPKKIDGLLVADKGISVTNIVNGTTRTQPVAMLVGQAAGAIAANAALKKIEARQVNIRDLQQQLLTNKAMLMPFLDATPDDPHFEIIQKIALCGIIEGTGVPFQWANQTWFHPDATMTNAEFVKNMQNLDNTFMKNIKLNNNQLTIKELCQILTAFVKNYKKNISTNVVENVKKDENFIYNWAKKNWTDWKLNNFVDEKLLGKREIAVLTHYVLDPFRMVEIDFEGKNKNKN